MNNSEVPKSRGLEGLKPLEPAPLDMLLLLDQVLSVKLILLTTCN